jgi:hypothetical protein
MSERQQVGDALLVIHPSHEEDAVSTPETHSFKQSWDVHRFLTGQAQKPQQNGPRGKPSLRSSRYAPRENTGFRTAPVCDTYNVTRVAECSGWQIAGCSSACRGCQFRG